MFYNSLEVGISAHSFGDTSAELFVDDVLLTTTRLRGSHSGEAVLSSPVSADRL